MAKPDVSRVTLVGAGVAGLTIATELVSRGIIPQIIDRAPEPGPQSCSWWAGGMLAPYCESESAEEPVVRLGSKAADWWEKHTQLVHRKGTLVLAMPRDRAELRRFAQLTSAFQPVNEAQINALEPDLENRFTQGLYYADEAHLAPRHAIQTLRQQLAEKGVHFMVDDADIAALATEGTVIDCRGTKARPDVHGLRGVKGEMLILKCPELQFQRPIRLLHPRIPLYIVPRGDGVFMLGATQIESEASSHPTVRSVMALLNAAYAISPCFAEADILEIGVDSRPAFSNNLPQIHRCGNVIRANGLYRHGFLLAPALAEMVANYLIHNEEPEWLTVNPES